MNPLPRQFATSETGVGGRLRARAQEFVVDEIPRYEPCGTGEHLYLRVRKRNLSHGDLIRHLSRHFHVSDRRIGFAGMKDKHALTTQLISVQTPADYDGSEIDPRVEVEWASRHRNKLRRGHLLGNRFRIFLRDVGLSHVSRVVSVLKRLEASGSPNFFGEQRFGYRCNNHLLGVMVFRRDWKGLLDELLGAEGQPFPPHQQEWRYKFDQGCFGEALRLLGKGFSAEHLALRQLARGQGSKRAVLGVKRTALSFWANSAQSAVFNGVVDDRISAGTLGMLGVGDLAWKHDSRSVFQVDAREAANPELHARLERLEVSPSGPLWAPGMTRASHEVADRELAALAAIGLTVDDLENPASRLEGARRPLRVRVANTGVASGSDEHGPFIRVSFDLPRGAYATMVLREIMKHEELQPNYSRVESAGPSSPSPGETGKKQDAEGTRCRDC